MDVVVARSRVLFRTYDGLEMAVPAKNPLERLPNGRFIEEPVVIGSGDLIDIAAKLYGLGLSRSQVARKLTPYFVSYKAARRKLGRLEQKQEFRDAIYKYAVVKADLETPQVLKGITRQAKRGRVDAAKLHLAVTERHTDKSDMPTEMTIRLEGIVRPERAAIPASTTDTDQDS